MCQRLAELTGAMRVFSTQFDASLLSCDDAAAVVADAAALEHMAAAVKALAAARSAEARRWKAGGYRSAEEELARTTGATLARAREVLALGRRLGEQPEVSDAARRGDLSLTQASAIADAVDTNPSATGQLLQAAAERGAVADLKDRCAAVKAATVDREARRQAIHRRRGLRTWTDQGGESHIVANGNPEDVAQVMASIAPLADQAFRTAREAGRREHPDAYRFDALVQLAMNATSAVASHDSIDASGAGSVDDGGEARTIRNGRDSAGPVPAEPTGNGAQDCETSSKRGATAQTASTFDSVAGAKDEGSPETNARWQAPDGAAPRTDSRAPTGKPPDGVHNRSQFGSDGREPMARTPGKAGKRRAVPATPRPRRGAPAKLLLRVDLTAFLRGFPADGEVCEMVGYGPISVSAVRDILRDSDPFVAAILTKGRQLSGVAHLGRKPTAYQQSALEWLYPTCAVAGCPCSARLQIDHRVDWSQTHVTILDWLDSLCPHHHQLKTRDNWSLTDGIGKRPFVPPGDPRHPKQKATAA